ncbi:MULTISPECIES: hypothetical protein [Agrobacterium tumefaciens complex]|uniref:Uncharacterized protein n=1 Tax=Agrobacterium genomosp. 13 str. CFBP 6927 TaxID=1183428 RepID=A0ABM9VN91_9HYPH|nr:MULTISPECIES: hypothetical protein [Agrobacterium tumefaciens complex]UXS34166.1 hypothetical protein FY152_18640 [Agrobacterium tumefaciens]CDN94751.1 hypothetical protein BN949_03922 [Agrobacterium tumefaciens]CUX64959.1 conserved hypothetical protein [Agrobacterium genomosp. 13 str. CFBP 6927]
MAYDWSGNNAIQQRYDRIILAVAGVVAISLATGTLFLRSQEGPGNTISLAKQQRLDSEKWHLRL